MMKMTTGATTLVGCALCVSVPHPFVCRCLNSPPMLPFHVPLMEPDARIGRVWLAGPMAGLNARVMPWVAPAAAPPC